MKQDKPHGKRGAVYIRVSHGQKQDPERQLGVGEFGRGARADPVRGHQRAEPEGQGREAQDRWGTANKLTLLKASDVSLADRSCSS